MGIYNQTESLKLVCCNDNNWDHKQCLRKMAFALNDDFECPTCDSSDAFRKNMLSNGVFIPSSDYMPPTIDPEEEKETPKPKRKRVEKKWINEKTFAFKTKALDAIEQENCWGYHYENKSAAGIKITYRCNFVKYRGQQCAAAIYLLYDATNLDVHLYRSDSAHNHDDENVKSNAVNKISGELETEIRSMYSIGMKPKAILYNLVRKHFTPPKKEKLVSFLVSLRKEKFGSEKLHFGTLEQWLKDSSNIPDDENDPFVVVYNVNMNEEKVENSKFHFFVSTKTLLRNAVELERIHTDATYKINWQGYPVLLIGMTDSNRKFHPFGVCVATHECAADFESLFQTLKNSVEQLFSTDIQPKVLIFNCVSTSCRQNCHVLVAHETKRFQKFIKVYP